MRPRPRLRPGSPLRPYPRRRCRTPQRPQRFCPRPRRYRRLRRSSNPSSCRLQPCLRRRPCSTLSPLPWPLRYRIGCCRRARRLPRRVTHRSRPHLPRTVRLSTTTWLGSVGRRKPRGWGRRHSTLGSVGRRKSQGGWRRHHMPPRRHAEARHRAPRFRIRLLPINRPVPIRYRLAAGRGIPTRVPGGRRRPTHGRRGGGTKASGRPAIPAALSWS